MEILLNWLRVAANQELVELILEYLDVGVIIEKGLVSIECIQTRIDTIKVFGSLMGVQGCALILKNFEQQDLVAQLHAVLFYEQRDLYYEALVDKEPIDQK